MKCHLKKNKKWGKDKKKHSAKGGTRMKANQKYAQPHDRTNKNVKQNWDFLPTEAARAKSPTIPSLPGLQSTRETQTLPVRVQTGFAA